MFYNDLKDAMEPEETYLKAKEIWNHFKCKAPESHPNKVWNHREFINLYLKSDVMLLADCFEKFSKYM
jgi:hypothetical protein